MALNDDEAQRQITQMVNFILNEAKDKAAETEAKALEDFNIEKLKLVQQMKDKVRQDYMKKAKQMEARKAIARSTRINKSRLKQIAARQQVLDEIQKETMRSLNKLNQSEDRYSSLIVELIVQGMLALLEDEVVVRCRECDKKVVESCFDGAGKRYNKVLSHIGVERKIKFHLDNEWLPPQPSKEIEGQRTCCGGVIVMSKDKKIRVDNTLDARLTLCFKDSLPEIRQILFPTKK